MPYKVYCREHNYSQRAKNVTEAKYLEKEHYRLQRCLEATHEQIS